MAVMHLYTKFGGNVFIQSGDIDIFRNPIWRPAAILDFRFRVTWAYLRGGVAFLYQWVQISSTDILAFYKMQYGRRPPSWICWESHETTREGQFMVAIPRKKIMIGIAAFLSYTLESPFLLPQNFSFWGLTPKI